MFLYTTHNKNKAEDMKKVMRMTATVGCRRGGKGKFVFLVDVNDAEQVPPAVNAIVDGDSEWTSEFYYES